MATAEEAPLPGITETLDGEHIFITGGTGFVGKAVIEKLLRSVPNLGRLYVLARGKGETTAQERVEQMLQTTTLFSRCREEQPESFRKVTVVSGDIQAAGLGLSEADTELLVSNVTVIIHSAAQVRFDRPVKHALHANLLGTQHAVELGRKLHNLKAFVHVSTAYINCHNLETDEIVYKPDVPAQKLLDAVEWMDEEWTDKLTPQLLGGRPNPYILTKALTETWIVETCSDLPLAIFRPSIVSSTAFEPIEGWTDTLNGPSGLIVSLGKGLLRTTMMDENVAIDVLPVDMCANMLIGIMWKILVQKPSEILIYNGCTSPINPTGFKSCIPWIYECIREHPYDTIFARPWAHLNVSFPVYYVEHFMFHLIPAYAYDGIMWLLGSEPRLVRLYRTIHMSTKHRAYFQCRGFKWTMNNYENLLASMNSEDKKTFNFDMRTIVWERYWRNLVVGTKKYLLNEDISSENLERCRKQYHKMRWRRYTWNFCLALAASRFLARFKWIRQWWASMMTILQISVQTFPILAKILLA
ncbi:fatty acyl-CoA reductase 1-like [Sycon ciliatum]|uniref:fatty acyl-CoA reductase 1-like n=1 Tax=Sycon ciliatum TaxID=27933 RepID=UPI0020AB92E4|eukprot:scpid3570/ scgid27973/ Fatty acyl-CoA reductase 1; Male sterility domain-containing protein 2